MKIGFIHIPKTAGTSIHKIIAEEVGPIVWYPPRSTPGLTETFLTSLDAFEPRLMRRPIPEQQKLLAQLDAHPAIGGHTQYRITRYVSPRFMFTSLRDPVDRFVSWYFHYVHPDNPNDRRPFREQTKDMDIASFAEFSDLMHENDNIMVRFLADVPKGRKVMAHDVDRAKLALSSLDAVIRAPTFDEDMSALMKRLGWGRYKPVRLKRSRSRAKSENSATAASVPESVIRFDQELWEFSAKLRRDG